MTRHTHAGDLDAWGSCCLLTIWIGHAMLVPGRVVDTMRLLADGKLPPC